MSELREFVDHLHAKAKRWNGEAFGWPAEYSPQRAKKPLDSKMAFTPADFWIGQSGLWFYSLMWEDGKDQPPTEFLDDRGIVKPTH